MSVDDRTLLLALEEHVRTNGGVVIKSSSGPIAVIIAASEWGSEAEDSPMAGGAAYGRGETVQDALTQLLNDTTLRNRA